MSRTAEELAQALGGALIGDGRTRIDGAASLAEAGATELAFVESAKWLEPALASKAGCLLVPRASALAKRTSIEVESPRLAFAAALELLYPLPAIAAGIHPTAVVDPSAVIDPSAGVGALTIIGPRAVVEAGAWIGPGSVLGADTRTGEGSVLVARVVLYPGTRIGARALIHAGAVLGADGFGFVRGPAGLAKLRQVGRLVIEDDVEIGANTTIDRGALGVTRIRQGAKIDNLVQIAHNVSVGRDVAISAQVGIAGSSIIEDGVTLAGQVGIGDHVTIEAGATAGGQAGIPSGKVIRKGQVVWGTPARPLHQIKHQFAQLGRLASMRTRLEELASRILRLEEGDRAAAVPEPCPTNRTAATRED